MNSIFMIGLLSGVPVSIRDKISIQHISGLMVKSRKRMEFMKSNAEGGTLIVNTTLGSFQIDKIESSEFIKDVLRIKFGEFSPIKKLQIHNCMIINKDGEVLHEEFTNRTLNPGDKFAFDYNLRW